MSMALLTCRIGIIGYDRVHQEVVDALAEGKFKGLEKLITRKIPLEEVVEKGIKALMTEKDTQSESKLSAPACHF